MTVHFYELLGSEEVLTIQNYDTDIRITIIKVRSVYIVNENHFIIKVSLCIIYHNIRYLINITIQSQRGKSNSV